VVDEFKFIASYPEIARAIFSMEHKKVYIVSSALRGDEGKGMI
jgi:hypothetical protein